MEILTVAINTCCTYIYHSIIEVVPGIVGGAVGPVAAQHIGGDEGREDFARGGRGGAAFVEAAYFFWMVLAKASNIAADLKEA